MISIFVDGASFKLPTGDTAIGVGIYLPTGMSVRGAPRELIFDFPPRPDFSNNVAEALAFELAISIVSNNSAERRCRICGDSQVIVRVLNGEYKSKDDLLYGRICQRARATLTTIQLPPELVWIPREENQVADRLSKIGLERSKAQA